MKISVNTTFHNIIYFLIIIALSVLKTNDSQSELRTISNTNETEYINYRNLHDTSEFKALPQEIIDKRLKRLRISYLS